MHLAIAIPTYNRTQSLKRCVDSILSQNYPTWISLSIVIANSASEDQTHDYIENLLSNDSRVVAFNQRLEDSYQNLICLADTIPKEADWVWLMGDDDKLDNPSAVSIVCETIATQQDPNLHFIHACHSRRAHLLNRQVSGTVAELCETFGCLEMLSWFSSIICTRQLMIDSLLEIGTKPFKPDQTAAFAHAFVLFKRLHKCNGVFIDIPLVKPQNRKMTAKCVEQWQEANIPQKMFYSINELVELKSLGLIDHETPYQFFRYHQGYLWDKLMGDLMDQLVWHVIPNRKLSLEMLEQHCANWQLMNELTLLTTDKAIQNSQLKVVREGANFVENISRHKSVGVDQFLEHALQLRELLELAKSAFVTPFEIKIYSRTGLTLAA